MQQQKYQWGNNINCNNRDSLFLLDICLAGWLTLAGYEFSILSPCVWVWWRQRRRRWMTMLMMMINCCNILFYSSKSMNRFWSKTIFIFVLFPFALFISPMVFVCTSYAYISSYKIRTRTRELVVAWKCSMKSTQT